MIDRAERIVRAEDVRPGDRAVVDGHHLDVGAATLRLEDVVLTGVPVARTSGSTRKSHVTVASHQTVTVLADGATLDRIEALVLGSLARPELQNGVHFVNGLLLVQDGDREWMVPLRDSAPRAVAIDTPEADAGATGEEREQR